MRVTDEKTKCRWNFLLEFIYLNFTRTYQEGIKHNAAKNHAKLLKLQSKGEVCLTREEARQIIKKAGKAIGKLAS